MENRGFLYGDGFFETILVKNGNICLKAYHIERVRKSLRLLNMLESINIDEILQSINLKQTFEQTRLRINFWRGGGGKYIPTKNELMFSYSIEPATHIIFCDSKPLKAVLYEDNKKADSKISQVKSLGAQLYVMASIFAQKNKVDEAIILNTRNEVIEFTTGNLFYVKNKKIYTPKYAGQVTGVAQKFFLNEVEQSVIEKTTYVQDLFEADEIFRTNAISGITPIIFGDKISNFELINEMQSKYKRLHS